MPWLPKQKVVVPVDFSEFSLQAVDTALELVEHPTSIHVIHVLPVLSPAEPGLVWDTLNDRSRIESAEGGLRERLKEEKFAGIQIHATVGDPGHSIAEYAQDNQADLIVLPSHGRTGIQRMLLGSVAERVIRLAHCPVLVLRQ